ncbi:MAG: hypothetical protein OXK76_06805 [Gammaproteobacteria bacterium]|nr:hypothetical protein [Gammaproteobacteria bacterium]
MSALPVIILVSATLYLLLLVGSGIYGATRKEGGSDLFRSDAVKVVTVALVAAFGVLPTEVLGFLWMTLVRDHFDVTAYLFFLVTGPAVAAMAAIQAFVLSRVYQARPVLLAAVYLGVYAATYAFWLSRIFNPPGDLVRYAAVVLIVGGIVMALFARFAWRRPA